MKVVGLVFRHNCWRWRWLDGGWWKMEVNLASFERICYSENLREKMKIDWPDTCLGRQMGWTFSENLAGVWGISQDDCLFNQMLFSPAKCTWQSHDHLCSCPMKRDPQWAAPQHLNYERYLTTAFTDQKTKTGTTTNIVFFSFHAYDRNPIKAFATL